jgi:hypothetical protein
MDNMHLLERKLAVTVTLNYTRQYPRQVQCYLLLQESHNVARLCY